MTMMATERNENRLRGEMEAIELKRLLVCELSEAMKDQQKTKMAMAHELGTSRSYLDRLLDERHTTVSLLTITRAAGVLGKRVVVTLTDAGNV
jgi:antitoxin HicB